MFSDLALDSVVAFHKRLLANRGVAQKVLTQVGHTPLVNQNENEAALVNPLVLIEIALLLEPMP